MGRVPGKSSIVAGLVLCSFLTSNAQWKQTNNLYGGRISSFASAGATIFATTTIGGVFKSTDAGTTWSKDDGPFNGNVLGSVTIGSKIFVLVPGAVQVSEDNGATWISHVTTGISGRCIAANGTTLILGTTAAGVYTSSDNANTWTAANNGLGGVYVECLLTNGGNIFVGFSNFGGVYKSADNGVTWTSVNTGLPAVSATSFAAIGTTIYLGSVSYVYKTTDNGATWTQASMPSSSGSVYLYVTGSSLLAYTYDHGILKSNDGANTWNDANNGLPPSPVNSYITPFFSYGTKMFVAVSPGGIYSSLDNGDSWIPSNTGLTSVWTSSTVMNGGQLFAATFDGIFTSNDNGRNWSLTSLLYPFDSPGCLFATNGKLFAGGKNNYGDTSCPVFLSNNNGVSWSSIPIPIPLGTYSTVTSLGAIGTSIFVGMRNQSGPVGGVFVTENNGGSWVNVTNDLPSLNISTMATNGSNIFVGTNDAGVYVSQNNGTSWTSSLPGQGINAMTVSNSVLYAGTNLGSIFISSDNGASWAEKKNVTGQVFALTVYNGNIFVEGGGGVLLSKDGGNTWQNVNTGLPLLSYSLTVAGSDLVASTNAYGIWSRPLAEMLYLPQTINFDPIPPVGYSAQPIPLNAIASSGLPVSYSSANPSVVQVSGTGIITIAPGTSLITATQVGNGTYSAATPVDQLITVVKGSQTISINLSSQVELIAGPFSLPALSSVGLPVSYASSNTSVASFDANVLTLISPGTTDITATQAGDGNYLPLTPVIQTLTVNKAAQEIIFEELAAVTISASEITLPLVSSSGLAISYTSSNNTVATVSGHVVSIVGYGVTYIKASQSGNDVYKPAADVTQALTVERDPIEVFNVVTPNGDGAHDFLKIKYVEEYPNTVYLYDRWGNNVFETAGYDNTEPQKRFDGTANIGGTRLLNEGTYFYVVDLGVAKKVTGYLELIR